MKKQKKMLYINGKFKLPKKKNNNKDEKIYRKTK